MSRHQDLPVILHNNRRGLITIEDGVFEVLQLSSDGRPPKKLLSSAVRNVLRVKLAQSAQAQEPGNQRLDIHVLIAKGRHLRLSKLHVLVEPINSDEARVWVESTMASAYGDAKPHRRILLLVNPVGGKGKARSTVKTVVLPILEAAGCKVEMIETTHSRHAEEITKTMELKYDVIAMVSGDGLIHEAFNGLAARSDARAALQIPIAAIPAGSANSLFLNLYGVKDTFNVELACLTAIKGQPLPIDLISVLFLPSMKLRWAFFSISIGLFVDLDIGTESLRWMGDTRFLLGFIKGAIINRAHKVRLRVKIEEDDKISMARKVRERLAEVTEKVQLGGGKDPLGRSRSKVNKHARDKPRDSASNGRADSNVNSPEATLEQERAGLENEVAHFNLTSNGTQTPKEMPKIKPLEPDNTWRTIESTGASPTKPPAVPTPTKTNDWVDGDGVLYASIGNLPYMDRDLMMWPTALPGSGLADMVIQNNSSRATLLSSINGAEKGDHYFIDSQHFYKISAVTCENLDRKNQPIFTLDGEAYPYDTFHAQIHPHLGKILSLDNHFYITDFLKRHHG
ncbi:ATP-NAD kinase-like domain-containing protein [Kockovaella imperatae]|uniref:ATP-NAD kinase-like domain-containing protein n=1 Tax=Kockovaella imperatae TaxID=4999 RepID=A0A1Y1USE2_9TREE|nr:ATP-NAD kinase-like domain-containing protein [Kockovaella imperatae]ORX40105.1 ATP-NAD kinase-like domain-containing protein [Kockovaella imperatae]